MIRNNKHGHGGKLLLVAAMMIAALVATLAPVAHADTITGGSTTVALDPTTLGALTGLGVSINTLGTATLVGLNVTFPITGGTTSWTGDIIDHNGSGLSLTKGTTVDLENFVINTATDILSGKVSYGSTTLNNVPLFDIGTGGVLTLDATAGGALHNILGIPNLSGATIGTATVSPIVATPEPSSLGLLAVGLLGVVALLSKR